MQLVKHFKHIGSTDVVAVEARALLGSGRFIA